MTLGGNISPTRCLGSLAFMTVTVSILITIVVGGRTRKSTDEKNRFLRRRGWGRGRERKRGERKGEKEGERDSLI